MVYGRMLANRGKNAVLKNGYQYVRKLLFDFLLTKCVVGLVTDLLSFHSSKQVPLLDNPFLVGTGIVLSPASSGAFETTDKNFFSEGKG
jgi:hypothetical protein